MEAARRFEIHELLARAAHALDEHDLKTLEGCFSEKATLLLQIEGVEGVARFDGRKAVMKLMRDSIAQQTDKRRHVTTNTVISGNDGKTLELVSNLTLTAVENGAIRLVTSGLYRDRVQQQDGRWVIVERRIELDMPY